MPQLSGGPAAQAGAAPLPLVEARGLTKEYARRNGVARVVDDVSFAIQPGETLGLVGESGCGKTTVARILLRLIEPTAGVVLFEGQPPPTASSAQMRALRRRMQIVFQDPYAALNPRSTIEQILADRIDEEGGPLVYAMESEEDQQRSFDSTCKKLHRYLSQSSR